MALTGVRVTVAATATLISSTVTRTGLAHTRTVRIQNPVGGQIVYLGGSNVSGTVYGYALAVGAEILLTLSGGDSIYGIVAATTQVVNVLDTGM